MSRTLFKYPIPRNRPKFSVLLPVGFRFARVNFQGEQLMMWADVDRDAKQEQYDFQCFGTGQDIPEHAKYLTSYDDGPFVFHLFQV